MISKNSGSVLFCYLDFEIVSCVCCNGTLGVRDFSWTCRPATDPEASPPHPVSTREKKTPGTKGIATHDNKSHNLITRMKNVGHNYHGLCSLMKLVWYLYHNSTKAFCVSVIVLSNNLQEQPSLLAPRRLGHFVRRDACTSVTEIPHWWRKICQECGQELRLVDVVVILL